MVQKRRMLLVILAPLALAVAAPAAHAGTYCVNAPACAGSVQPTVGAAFTAGMADTAARIEIGPGEYTGPFTYTAGAKHVEIVGAGIGQTIIKGNPAGNLLTVSSTDPTSIVQDLTVEHSGAAGYGLNTSGILVTRVRATSSSTAAAGSVDSGVIRNAEFVATGLENALRMSQTELLDSSVTSASFFGVFARDAIIRRSSISTTGGNNAVYANGTLTIEDSVLSGGVDAPLTATGTAGTNANVTARHLTIRTSGAIPGVRASSYLAGISAQLDLRDSIVRGGTVTACAGTGNLTASATVSGVNVAATGSWGVCASSPNIGSETVLIPLNLISADPLFVDEGAGDLRLTASSPLVDAGTPGALGAGESTTDRLGLPRLVDGNSDGITRRDIGAFEYQPPLPPLPPDPPVPDPVSPNPPVTPNPPAATKAPRISSLRISPSTFRAAKRGASIAKAKPRGAKVTVKLTRAAKAAFRVERRKGKRWVKVSGSFSRNLKAGTNRLKFTGRVKGRALKPGRYRLRVVATAGGKTSAVRRASFRIAR